MFLGNDGFLYFSSSDEILYFRGSDEILISETMAKFSVFRLVTKFALLRISSLTRKQNFVPKKCLLKNEIRFPKNTNFVSKN